MLCNSSIILWSPASAAPRVRWEPVRREGAKETAYVRTNQMHPLPTSQHWSPARTDDDINAAVQQFLQTEGSKLHGKTWQDTTAEVTQWLGAQIQKERDGWTHKTRAAMQEIEAHRKETLKFQGILQESAEQMKMVAECCNLPEDTLKTLADKEPQLSLPLYIECLTGVLNALMEERIVCLQILRAEEKGQRAGLPSLLKTYIENLKHHAERAHKESKVRIESVESANKQCILDMQKMKKVITRKQEEIDKLHSKLQEIKDITIKKFKEVKELKERERELDEKVRTPTVDKPSVGTVTERSTPSSHLSAPTPVMIDEQGIKISEEKLSRLRRSAKKLENSLQDALDQMDNYRNTTKPTKHQAPTLFGGKSTQLGQVTIAHDLPPSPRKEKLMPSSLQTWTTKFEVAGPAILKDREKERERERELEAELIRERERERHERKMRERQKAKESRRGFETNRSSDSEQPTFRSLMKSLDEVKKNKGQRLKTGGQVTKCLRCNKLFTLNDNHKKACCYHPKGKERIEQYSDRGKLVKVSYVWKCCMLGADAGGCTYGQHI